MIVKAAQTDTTKLIVTVNEVNRVLDVGRLLLSVLSPQELDQLQQLLGNQVAKGLFTPPVTSESEAEIGNTGVT
jgi:hypothetical protein